MTRKIHRPPSMTSAGSRAGHPPLLLEIPSPKPSEPSQLLLACHMLKNWNERKHCVVFGLSVVGWGRVGLQPPGPHPAAWLNAGRKEVKAAALGRRNESSTSPSVPAHSVCLLLCPPAGSAKYCCCSPSCAHSCYGDSLACTGTEPESCGRVCYLLGFWGGRR